MAKPFASEISVEVCEAIQIHGGYGYTKDYPAEKYWRDSKLCTIVKVLLRFNESSLPVIRHDVNRMMFDML
jgi:alkylation response protein AidB-like acyl-CoA dehydrogenase